MKQVKTEAKPLQFLRMTQIFCFSSFASTTEKNRRNSFRSREFLCSSIPSRWPAETNQSRSSRCISVSYHQSKHHQRTIFLSLVYFLSPLSPFADQAINNASCDDELDISALDAFCHMIKKEPDLCATAARLLAGRIQSQIVRESLLSLDALEGNQLILISDVLSVRWTNN